MNIEQMLDTLADYQAQVDYLEMQKRELLDAVKIPDEVLAAQDEANKKRQQLEGDFQRRWKENQQMKAEALSAVHDPEMPPEYLAALEAARIERGKIEARFSENADNDLETVRAAKAKIDVDLQEQIRDVYRQVETRKQEISAEFSGKAEAAQDNIAKLTAEIKAQTVKEGKSFKGSHYQAVFQKGRVTWITDALDGVFFSLNGLVETMKNWDSAEGLIGRSLVREIISAMTKARKEGAPSVSIRRIG